MRPNHEPDIVVRIAADPQMRDLAHLQQAMSALAARVLAIHAAASLFAAALAAVVFALGCIPSLLAGVRP
ncbi:hypothetical protein [Novosphingobium sp. LASN5T]|uniref:hypothetical protein n=1 Tax=Novosphingobium sp. LASN5T TaxID=2491021 RepID=UPI000F5E6D3B|nr:hypothetical protein [Novosphingobium sp. LASN5T]RQW45312.1 hypothetical protein EH199_05330 [Novosphingobium sp. LASN5T]